MILSKNPSPWKLFLLCQLWKGIAKLKLLWTSKFLQQNYSYQISHPEDLFRTVKRVKHSSCLDWQTFCFRIPVELEDGHKTSFMTPLDKLYCLFIYLFFISAFISSLFKVELHLTYKKANKHQQQDNLYI